jgi:hypothetical protein
LGVSNDRLHEMASERDRLQLQLLECQKRLTTLQEDLTQVYAEVDIHKLQAAEQADETDQLRVRVLLFLQQCAVI